MLTNHPAETVPVFVLTRELTFSSRIRESASALGMSVKVVRSIESMRVALTESGPFNRVIVDLSTIQMTELPELTALSQLPTTNVIAVGAHVQRELLGAVESIGRIAVYTRSEFVAQLPLLLQEPFPAQA